MGQAVAQQPATSCMWSSSVLYGLQLMHIVQVPTHMQPVSGFLTLLYEYAYKQNICVLAR